MLNEISTCRCELKKLAQILVGSDPDLFPSPENLKQPFKDLAAPNIRATNPPKKPASTQSHPLWDPDNVCTAVRDRLKDFSFLNDPPTATVGAFIYDTSFDFMVF